MSRLYLVLVLMLVGAAREAAAGSIKLPAHGWTLELPGSDPWVAQKVPYGGSTADALMLQLPDRVLQILVASLEKRPCNDTMAGKAGVLARDMTARVRKLQGMPATWFPVALVSPDPAVWIVCRQLVGRSLEANLIVSTGSGKVEDEQRLVAIANALEARVMENKLGSEYETRPDEVQRVEKIVQQARASKTETTLPELGITIVPHPWRLDEDTLKLDVAYEPRALAVSTRAVATDVGCADGFVREHSWQEEVATPDWVPAGYHTRALAKEPKVFHMNDMFGRDSSLELCADVPGGVMRLDIYAKGGYKMSTTEVVTLLKTVLQKMRTRPRLEPEPVSIAPVAGTLTLPRAANAWFAHKPDDDGSVTLSRLWPQQFEYIELKVDTVPCAGQLAFPFLPAEWKGISSEVKEEDSMMSVGGQWLYYEACTTARDGRRILARGSSPQNASEARVAEMRTVLSAIAKHVGHEAPAERVADRARQGESSVVLFPDALTIGFSADRVTYQDLGLPESSGWALNLALGLGYLDVALGAISGPESGFNGKMGLRLLAWPRPERSRFSILVTTGVSARSPLDVEPVDTGLAFRGYVTTKVRLTCGVVANASYEPALQDSVFDTYSLGLELQVKYLDKDFSSVCRK